MSQAKPDKPITPAHAWQPFTPRGVAAYANTTGTRLFFVQCFVAAIVALTCIWFVAMQWAPVITDAITNFSGTSLIQNGAWTTTNSQPQLLAGNHRLEVILDPREVGGVSGAADVSAIVTVPSVNTCGVLGCATIPYERGYTINVSQSVLTPWWDAWRRPIEALLGIGIALCVLFSWWLLAIPATPVVKLIVFFADREVSWGGAWRMANAALLAGAFIVAFGIMLYGLGVIDPLRLALFYALHLICDLALVVTCPFFLIKIPEAQRGPNPFNGATELPAVKLPEATPAKKENPFQ